MSMKEIFYKLAPLASRSLISEIRHDIRTLISCACTIRGHNQSFIVVIVIVVVVVVVVTVIVTVVVDAEISGSATDVDVMNVQAKKVAEKVTIIYFKYTPSHIVMNTPPKKSRKNCNKLGFLSKIF